MSEELEAKRVDDNGEEVVKKPKKKKSKVKKDAEEDDPPKASSTKKKTKKKKRSSSRHLNVTDEDGDESAEMTKPKSSKKKKKKSSSRNIHDEEENEEEQMAKPKSSKKKKKSSSRKLATEDDEDDDRTKDEKKKLMTVTTGNIENDQDSQVSGKENKKKSTKNVTSPSTLSPGTTMKQMEQMDTFHDEQELMLQYNDFWSRQSKRVARSPCIHFWVSFIISMVLSGIAMTIGEFSVSANNAGWQSRGTLIADRQTQVMLIEYNAAYLFYDGIDAWNDLINNVQPGWEDDDDEVDRRMLAAASSSSLAKTSARSKNSRLQVDTRNSDGFWSSSWADMIIPKADRIQPHLVMEPSTTTPNKQSQYDADGDLSLLLPLSSNATTASSNSQKSVGTMTTFMSTEEMTRKLQGTSLLQACDISWYNLDTMTRDHRLWPLWKTKKLSKDSSQSANKKFASILDSDVIRDLCIAEMNTLTLLEENDLCFGCDDNTWTSKTGNDGEIVEHTCLPPYSIVLYVRFQVQDFAFELTCDELATSWDEIRVANEEQWYKCVQDVKTIYDPTDTSLPPSCPLGFETTMVDEFYTGTPTDEEDGDNDGDDNDDEDIIRYTSSIFPTTYDDLQDLYDNYDDLDTAEDSKVVSGAYGSQWEGLISIHMDTSVTRDMSLATGSAFIVALAIVVHTKSLFLTMIGLLQIILSFPLAFFVYKFVAGFDFFPFLNFIGVFVLFALGANDVFVAVDKWKNARLLHPTESVELVAAIAFPDAAGAMFQTTLTTAVAFFATAIGPVAPIQMFAFFVGLLVLFDYLLNVILVFPALCIYDKSVQASAKNGRRPNCCMTWACCKSGNEEEVAAHHHEHQQHEHDLHKKLKEDSSELDVEKQNAKALEDEEDEEVHPSFIHRVLLGYYNVLHRLRWGLLVACIVALVLSIIFAAQLTLPLSSDVRVLQEDVPLEQAYTWRKNLLYTALDSIRGSRANVIWGVIPDDTGTLTDPASWSQLVLDPKFDPSSEESQMYLSKFCDDFFDQEFAAEPEADFTCAIQRFDIWLQEQSQSDAPEDAYVENCNNATSLPVPQANFHSCISSWTYLVDELSILSQDGVVRVIILPFYSRVLFSNHHDVLTKEWNLIEDWMTEKNKKEAPDGSKGAYFSSFDFWWYDTNDQMLGTAYSSAGIALSAAAIVVLFASRSIMLTFFSVITIAYVLTSVTATLVSLGWTLGFLESICFAILIGISVDFVIHFGHSYSSIQGDVGRGERTKYALIHMGPSVLAAAFTMICSAVIMLFTVITFFQKFALILFFTVIQSVVGSFIVFLTMSDCIGPSHPTYVVDKCMEKCRGVKSEDENFEKNATEHTAKKSGDADQSSDST